MRRLQLQIDFMSSCRRRLNLLKSRKSPPLTSFQTLTTQLVTLELSAVVVVPAADLAAVALVEESASAAAVDSVAADSAVAVSKAFGKGSSN